MKEYKVKGYYGKWFAIASYKEWLLLEHCTYGDETCCLVVRKDNPEEAVCETFDDIVTALEDEDLI